MVVLTGPNGAGKTNILEALSLLTAGRGLRRAKLADVQQVSSQKPWAVSARLDDDTQIGTGKDPDAPEGSDRRVSVVNGARVRGQLGLSEHIVMTWLTPAMERLWTESPSTRRRLLDRLTLALDPAHATRLSRYEEALAQRNKLLKEGRMDDRWLSGVEHVLASEGMAVAAARRELVKALMRHMPEPASPLAHLFPAPQLCISGVESWLDTTPSLLAEDRLRHNLATARAQDSQTGHTSLGPHRSDLEAVFPLKQMPAALCSTGEQKAMLTSLILAHARVICAERRMAPLVLLDEVAAHFDDARKKALFDDLRQLGGQVWLTGAEATLFDGLMDETQHFHIEDGQAHPRPRRAPIAPSTNAALCA